MNCGAAISRRVPKAAQLRRESSMPVATNETEGLRLCRGVHPAEHIGEAGEPNRRGQTEERADHHADRADDLEQIGYHKASLRSVRAPAESAAGGSSGPTFHRVALSRSVNAAMLTEPAKPSSESTSITGSVVLWSLMMASRADVSPRAGSPTPEAARHHSVFSRR